MNIAILGTGNWGRALGKTSLGERLRFGDTLVTGFYCGDQSGGGRAGLPERQVPLGEGVLDAGRRLSKETIADYKPAIAYLAAPVNHSWNVPPYFL